MKRVLLGFAAALAAAVASAAPAQAMDNDSRGFSVARGDGSHVRRDFRRDCFDSRRGDSIAGRRGDRHHRHHRRGGGGCDSDVVLGVYGGEWALYNNRTWEPDSYNDWWHDRPDRAFPRWMQHNENCERLWWSGGGWRC